MKNYFDIKKKEFIHNPTSLLVIFLFLIFELFGISFYANFANYIVQIIQFAPLIICICYFLIDNSDELINMYKLHKVYYGIVEIELSNFLFFSFYSLVIYAQLFFVLLCLLHKHIYLHTVSCLGMLFVAWIYTEILYVLSCVIMLLIRNNLVSCILVSIFAWMNPFVNIAKCAYMGEVKKQFEYTGLKENIEKYANQALKFGIENSNKEYDIRSLLVFLISGLCLYGMLILGKKIFFKDRSY